MPELAVVMPAYNERGALGIVIGQWTRHLRRQECDFVLWVVDDGSTDGSDRVLEAMSPEHPELHVIRQPNTGHGQACLAGYRRAVKDGAEWILQIDSDGQCDPTFFEDVWSARTRHPVVYGYRRRREDGLPRLLVSRFLCAWVFVSAGVYVRDANVPYRLMRSDALADALNAVPADADLANIFVAVRQQYAWGIEWRDIVFRKRVDGRSHLPFTAGVGKMLKLAAALRAARKSLLD